MAKYSGSGEDIRREVLSHYSQLHHDLYLSNDSKARGVAIASRTDALKLSATLDARRGMWRRLHGVVERSCWMCPLVTA